MNQRPRTKVEKAANLRVEIEVVRDAIEMNKR